MLGPQPAFSEKLLQWYDQHRRNLPWRLPTSASGPLDPYQVLVSEAMLQQTQVATVIPYFLRFVARFPTVKSLADSDEQEVLRLWQGLGYYSRARNLRKAAGKVVNEFGGKVPATVEELLTLPGVGRYTAGAIASIAHGTRAPILDGNVIRVLCRLDLIRADPRSRAAQAVLWARAEQVLPDRRVGDFNSAMMELGATVCVPKGPACLMCPVREHCAAREAGVQEEVPAPKKAKPTPLEKRVVLCIRRGDGKYLIEQRPGTGRWAGMWQFVTVVAGTKEAKGHPAVRPGSMRKLGAVRHALTHRRYEFGVYVGEAVGSFEAGENQRWVRLGELGGYPMSKPQLEVGGMVGEGEGPGRGKVGVSPALRAAAKRRGGAEDRAEGYRGSVGK